MTLNQLLPFFIIFGGFSVYGFWQLARYCFFDTLDELVIEDLINNITPTETPFSKMIAAAKASEPDYKGNDLNNV